MITLINIQMKQFFLAAASVVFVLTMSCASRKTAVPSDQSTTIIDKKWQLIELDGKPVADKVNGKTPSLEFLSAQSRYSAVTGCNGVGGEFTLGSNNSVKFSAGMSTMMACEDMSVENGLKNVFAKADNFVVEGDLLTLHTGKATPLAKFKLLPVQKTSLEGTWELDYISGPRIAFSGLYPTNKPTITFDTTTSKVSGNSSCNNYNGSVTLDGAKIKFSPLAATKMACEGAGESTYFTTLDKITSYSIHENTLTFIMGDIAMMRFHKKQ